MNKNENKISIIKPVLIFFPIILLSYYAYGIIRVELPFIPTSTFIKIFIVSLSTWVAIKGTVKISKRLLNTKEKVIFSIFTVIPLSISQFLVGLNTGLEGPLSIYDISFIL
tara:strand:+ start:919 stop:1251 length:333 start_codon:yes stop_codon:yes gene_type:complete